MLASLDERADAADHFEFWTFPHSPLALTRTNTRTEAERDLPGRVGEWIEDVLMDNHVFGLLNRVARRVPRAIPALNRAHGPRGLAARAGRLVVPHLRQPAARALHRDGVRGPARSRRPTAVRGARAILERHPVSFPVELRLVAADDALLSPAHARDSAYVAVHVFEGMPWEAPFREVEALMGSLGGRPHWGKWSFLTAAELAGRYPAWDAFQAARRELDPGGRFENEWVTPRARRGASEKRPALAAVGRDGRDAAAALDEVQDVEALAQLARLRVAHPHAVADPQVRRRGPSSGVWTSPAPSWRSSRRPAGEAGRGRRSRPAGPDAG